MSKSVKANGFPKVIYAHASVRSSGEKSLFDSKKPITSENVKDFHSAPDLVEKAVYKLKKAGFKVLQVNEISIAISGTKEVFEKAFKTKLVKKDQKTDVDEAGKKSRSLIDSEGSDTPGLIRTEKTDFEDVIEGVAISEPVTFFAPALPPTKSYWHLNVPADVSLSLNADRAHRFGFTGRDVNVAMVDSGWYRHPFFNARGYRANPVVLAPGAANPLSDESGHGTGESANVFAIAPDCRLTMVKMGFDAIAAFNEAVSLAPDIISCSWGWSIMNPPIPAFINVISASIANAVASGITVIFSAGNGHWGFPAQHPDVIAAGGVYMDETENFQASNYASGFASRLYPNRNVPDVSGLVGLLPRAQYIMLPVEPNDNLDIGLSGGVHPAGDETLDDDGWAAFSGTSAAAPQVAGTVALMKQVCGRLSPAAIKSILQSTSRDITTGNSHPNTGSNPATLGFDLATGAGLVNVFRAVISALFRCIFIQPVIVTQEPTANSAPAINEDQIQMLEELVAQT